MPKPPKEATEFTLVEYLAPVAQKLRCWCSTTDFESVDMQGTEGVPNFKLNFFLLLRASQRTFHSNFKVPRAARPRPRHISNNVPIMLYNTSVTQAAHVSTPTCSNAAPRQPWRCPLVLRVERQQRTHANSAPPIVRLPSGKGGINTTLPLSRG